MVLILVILVLPGRVTTPTNAKVTPRISCLRAEGGWDVVCISGVPGDEWSVLLPVCAALGDVEALVYVEALVVHVGIRDG